jgi:transposase
MFIGFVVSIFDGFKPIAFVYVSPDTADMKRKQATRSSSRPLVPPSAATGGTSLTSYTIGALPLLNRLFERMQLRTFLSNYLPKARRGSKVAIVDILLLLVRNFLVSREPLYSVAQWASVHDPQELGLSPEQVRVLNDDRTGRALGRLFDADQGSLVLALLAHVVREFRVSLDELHNDSTTVTFHGEYDASVEGLKVRSKPAPHITYGHNKDHRPDLKQLLFILTTTSDGCVPVHFRTMDGNTPDDLTHWETWKTLRDLRGNPDFLYIADCKLASVENLTRIHCEGGRFITVLPRTRSEDQSFRKQVQSGDLIWSPIWEKRDPQTFALIDEIEIAGKGEGDLLPEGFRLLWFRSSAKARNDARTRGRKMERAKQALLELNEKLHRPRTRWRDRDQIEAAVAKILEESGTAEWSAVTVLQYEEETYRPMRPGRPGKDTPYRRSTKPRFSLAILWSHEKLEACAREDGLFPLVTNEMHRSPLEVLLAYKRQPHLEKRFSQLKTDFAVAPVFLKNVDRVQALLCVYFLALLTQALLEREVRNRLDSDDDDALPLYPEGRACKRPCARRIIDLFASVQRHQLQQPDQDPQELVTTLTPLQRRLVRMLGASEAAFRPR